MAGCSGREAAPLPREFSNFTIWLFSSSQSVSATWFPQGICQQLMVIFSSGDISLVLSLMGEVLCAGWSSGGLGDFHALILNSRVEAQLCFLVHGVQVVQTLNNVRPPGFSAYVPGLLVQNFGARLTVYWVKYSKEVN